MSETKPRAAGIDAHDKAAQRKMWDAWWYDRFEIPHEVPPTARRIELAMDGERFGAVLLENVAPKTCAPFGTCCPTPAT